MNTIKAAWLIAQKDFRVFFRDRTSLVLGFVLPMALVSVFGFVMKFAFGGGSSMPRVAIYVSDQDQSQASQALVAAMRGSTMLRVLPAEGDPAKTPDELRTMIDEGAAHHALVIEKGFGEKLAQEDTPPLLLLRDPGRKMEDQIIRAAMMESFMKATGGKAWPAIMKQMMQKNGLSEAQANQVASATRTVGTLIETLFDQADPGNAQAGDNPAAAGNPAEPNAAPPNAAPGEPAAPAAPAANQDEAGDFNFMQDMVPMQEEDHLPPSRPKSLSYQLAQSVSGVTVMMLMFGLTGAAASLIQERDLGTLRRLLVSAVPQASVFWGKFAFAMLMGLAQLAVLFTFGDAVFQIDVFRDPITLAALSITWSATATSFGMLLAATAKTAKQAEGLATLLILVMAALGGCWFPVQMLDLPVFAQWITRCTLTYWSMTGYQGMFWDQLSWTNPKMLTAMGIQWGFVLVASSIAVWAYRRNYRPG